MFLRKFRLQTNLQHSSPCVVLWEIKTEKSISKSTPVNSDQGTEASNYLGILYSFYRNEASFTFCDTLCTLLNTLHFYDLL